MLPSLRRSLLAVAALAAIACAGALVAIVYLGRTSTQHRLEQAHEIVAREVERLSRTLAPVPPEGRAHRGRHGLGELRSGWVEAPERVDPSSVNVAEAVRQAASQGELVVFDRPSSQGVPIAVAAVPVEGGGYAWAALRVVMGREARILRGAILMLALVTLGLVGVSVRTVVVVEREHARLTRELADKERLAALGRVAAGVAHEVRNPLAAIKLRTDLAQASGEAPPSLARDLADISAEVARLDRTVADLLVVAGRRTGPRAERDLGALARKRADLLGPWAKERGVAIEVEGEARAAIDEDAVARAVDNLLRNAVEASPRGAPEGATVSVRVAEEGGTSRIDVIDSGTGVPATHAGELFEPFFTTKPEGTGLGLALSRAVAKAHSGSLTYAREGGRTRFTLSVPKA